MARWCGIFCFWYNGLIVWLMSAPEIWRESRMAGNIRPRISWNKFYEVKNKTLIWKQEANIKVLHNSYLLMFDVKTMLTISVITMGIYIISLWLSPNRKAVITSPTFSAVPTWLATMISKNRRDVKELKHSKTDCSHSAFQ